MELLFTLKDWQPGPVVPNLAELVWKPVVGLHESQERQVRIDFDQAGPRETVCCQSITRREKAISQL